MNKITVIDYGMGNIRSVVNAFNHLECDVNVSSEPTEISKSNMIVLPGVGSFSKAMKKIKDSRIDLAIFEVLSKQNRKILGICLGMQLMGIESSEEELTSGLGIIPENVRRFSSEEVQDQKIPHVGFNQVKHSGGSLYKGMSELPDFYFTHSYRMLKSKSEGFYSLCDYGVEFVASYEFDNIYATQFHPEKSQTNGLTLLQNFLKA